MSIRDCETKPGETAVIPVHIGATGAKQNDYKSGCSLSVSEPIEMNRFKLHLVSWMEKRTQTTEQDPSSA